jgi:hypothetical protein
MIIEALFFVNRYQIHVNMKNMDFVKIVNGKLLKNKHVLSSYYVRLMIMKVRNKF